MRILNAFLVAISVALTAFLIFMIGYFLEPGMALVQESDTAVLLYDLDRLSAFAYGVSALMVFFSLCYMVVGVFLTFFVSEDARDAGFGWYFSLGVGFLVAVVSVFSYVCVSSFYI